MISLEDCWVGQWRMYAEAQFKLSWWLDRYNHRECLKWQQQEGET